MDSKKIKLDMKVFFIKALSDKPAVYEQIDAIYQENIDSYYQLAVSDPLYRHPLLTSGNLQQEEYARKLVGIFNSAQVGQTEEIFGALLKLFKKAYPYAGAYLKTHNEVDLLDFGKALFKKYKCDMDIDDALNYNAAMIFLCLVNGVPYINADEILFDMHELYHFYDNRPEIPQEIVAKMQELAKQLPDDLFDQVVNGTEESCGTEILYSLENLSQTALFRSLELTSKDKELLSFIYYLDSKNQKTMLPMEEHAYYHLHILLLCRAYKEVKDAYFKNNKETEYTELSVINEKYRQLKTTSDALKNNTDKLLDWVNELQRENKRLQQDIAQWKQNEQELYGLRNLMFTLKNDDLGVEIVSQEAAPDWASYRILVIGGLEAWQKRLQEATGCKCINTDAVNFDLRLIDNADILAFNTRHISHAIYERAINRTTGQKIVFLNNDNIDKNMAAIAACIK